MDIQPGDQLQLKSYGSVVCVIAAVVTYLDRQGNLGNWSISDHTPSVNRTLVTSTGSGISLKGTIDYAGVQVVSGTVVRGQCFAILNLLRGGQALLLAQGYVTSDKALKSPFVESSTDGAGLLRPITGTDPAAGAEVVETVPVGARWALKSVKASLVAAVAVANRQPIFYIISGGIQLWISQLHTAQVATETKNYFWLIQQPWQLAGDTNGNIYDFLPLIVLKAGSVFGTNTAGIQAADNWGAPTYLVEEWIEP